MFVDTRIYPQEAVLAACYEFLDRGYFFLKYQDASRINVAFSPRSKKDALAFKRDFHNALLHAALRRKVYASQKKVHELVVKRALSCALYGYGPKKTGLRRAKL
jgi:His-Xaa-Ser system protein HxsD